MEWRYSMTQIPKPNYKRRTPKRGERGRINKEQYQLALDYFGDTCTICNATPVEMHHVVYRSQGGRGGYRNLMPLCKSHHNQAHQQRAFADSLRQERLEAFGEHYYMDAHDLCYHNLIDEPSPEEFENYMKRKGEFK